MAKRTWVVEVSLPESGPIIGLFVVAENEFEAKKGASAMFTGVGYRVGSACLHDFTAKQEP